MNLDRCLRQASTEVRHAVAGREGAPITFMARHGNVMWFTAAATVAVMVTVAVGILAFDGRGPEPLSVVGQPSVTTTTSAASFEPSGNVIALIGIGEGLDASLTPIEVEGDGEVGASDFRSPVGAEYVELPFHELIRRVHADHPEVQMSDSMMTIMTEGLDGLDVTPFLYQLTERDGVMIENGYFDVPSLGVFVEISQQTFLADWDARHRPALEQEPGAVWQTGVEVPEDNDWIQIVAYSPAIEREVRIFFGQRTAATDDTAGFEFSVGEARELAQQILEAVAVPE